MRWACSLDVGLLVAAALLAPASAHGQTGGIAGVVLLEGKPLPGAMVVAAPVTSRVKPPNKKYSISDPSGAYSLEGLDDDDYAMCVFVQDDDVVNPCQWTSERQQVTIRGGQKARDQKINVKRGAVLRVHLLDPHTLLASSRYPTRTGVSSLVGVFTEKGFLDARRVSENTRGFEYRLAIPTGTRVKPYVDAAGARLLDANGAPFEAGLLTLRPAIPNSPDLEFTLTIAPSPAGAK